VQLTPEPQNCYFLLVVRCVSAEPAAVFADLLELALLSALDAAVAALPEVIFGGALCCESAEPAADLDDLDESLLRSTFDAAVAARALVVSDLLTIVRSYRWLTGLLDNINGGSVIKD